MCCLNFRVTIGKTGHYILYTVRVLSSQRAARAHCNLLPQIYTILILFIWLGDNKSPADCFWSRPWQADGPSFD